MFKQFTLDNGLRVVVVPMQGTTTVTVMTMFGIGSKYETHQERGLSHFLEHMIFKGTEKRPTAMSISSALDAVGGEFNAFTSKDYTAYYTKLDARHVDLACDVLSDIILNSKFEQEEITRETGVIIEEMRMYQDTPMRHIHDVYEHLLYGDTSFGWSIIGTEGTVSALKREDFVRYYGKNYNANNGVLCVAGNVTLEQVEKLASQYFTELSSGEKPVRPVIQEEQENPRLFVHYKETDQAHMMMGFRTVTVKNEDRFALEVLSALLGGYMSSRMFVSVRERRGLGYYIRTSSEHTVDAGYMMTACGVDTARAEEAVKAILEEYRRVREEPIEQEEIDRAKEFLKGKMMIDLESSDEMASWSVLQQTIEGSLKTIDDIHAAFDAVTLEDVARVAKLYLIPSTLNLAMIAPYKDTTSFEELLASYS